jgi:hypothetical protein
MMLPTHLNEPSRAIPIQDRYDVVVCGGGPAGIAAAISAGRAGARTCIIELQGCLGGIWTAGVLCYILDSINKDGLIVEIREKLRARGAIGEALDLYDAEAMKLLLDELCAEAGVDIRLYTRVVHAVVADNKIGHVVLEAKEGRFAITGKCFVDTTGDGDLAALAGCGFDIGREGDGLVQPMTLMALVSNVPAGVRAAYDPRWFSATCLPKEEFLSRLKAAGHSPSYTKPSLFPLPNGLCALMVNHEYERSGLSSRDLTAATISARREVNAAVGAMRKFGPEWSGVQLVATAQAIGVREGRRIHGLYTVNVHDIVAGVRHPDGITRVTFPIDVHSVRKSEGGGYTSGNVAKQEPYDIPLRALIAKDVTNLFMAGRCISGDFLSHASYRVTGNSVSTGEAAGLTAAQVAAGGGSAHDFAAASTGAAVLARSS